MNLRNLLLAILVAILVGTGIVLLVVFIPDQDKSSTKNSLMTATSTKFSFTTAANSTTTSSTTSTTTITKSMYTTKNSTGVYSKLLVATGTTDDILAGLDSVEVINLADASKTCNNLANYPVQMYGASGGLDQNKTINIFGGLLVDAKAYKFNGTGWADTFELNTPRYLFSSVTLQTLDSIMVIGGVGSVNPPLSSTEILTNIGWAVAQPVPNIVYLSCVVKLNVSTIMVISGRGNLGRRTNKTWIYDAGTKNWTQGIDYVNAISSHGCAMIKMNSNSDVKSIIVIGGSSNAFNLSDTNILDFKATLWRPGPSLPFPILNAPVVEDPWGGVVVVGGRRAEGLPLNTIYRLATAEDQWMLMPQTLKEARYKHLAFLIPDKYASCK